MSCASAHIIAAPYSWVIYLLFSANFYKNSLCKSICIIVSMYLWNEKKIFVKLLRTTSARITFIKNSLHLSEHCFGVNQRVSDEMHKYRDFSKCSSENLFILVRRCKILCYRMIRSSTSVVCNWHQSIIREMFTHFFNGFDQLTTIALNEQRLA